MSATEVNTSETTHETTPEVSIENQFKDIYEELSNMVSGTRNLQTRVKELSRQYRTACKPKKVKKHTVMHDPMNISAELLKYLKQTAGTQMTKSEAMKMVSTRVKTDGLQNPENKRQFTPNKALGKVLNMSTIKTITFVELNKYLSHHFTPVPSV